MQKRIPKFLFVLILIIICALWISSGFYTIRSGEEAVVLRFGSHVKTVAKAGLNWHIPLPFESVIKVNLLEIKRIEFGFLTIGEATTYQRAQYAQIEQRLMLTGDENLVNVEAAIQYKINSIEDYVFNVKDQTNTLEIASEAAIRRVIANNTLDKVLTENKFAIQQEIEGDLQSICDHYSLGIVVLAVQLQDVNPPEEVDAAFKDVANAREDKNSYINEAVGYKNEIIPRARGNAAEILNDARAYKEKRIAEALGDVAGFNQIMEKYEHGKEVTRVRMYLETMEQILPGMNKYIMDGENDLVKLLPLIGDRYPEELQGGNYGP